MSYAVPTLDEMHGFLIAFWKAMFPGSNVGSRFSYHWKRLRAYAGAVTDLHAHIDSAIRDVMPDTSLGAFLTRWGIITGVPKKVATPARGTKALRVFGTAASAVAVGNQLRHDPTGLIFQVNSIGVIPAAPLYVDVDCLGVSTGSATRLNAGETLTFLAAPAGITAAAKLVANLDQDGFDVEQDTAYSVRVNDELGKPRMGGSQDDFVKWALQVVGVADAYCYPNRAGVGTVDVAALHSGNGSSRALSLTERAAVLARINGTDGQAGTLGAAPAQVAATGGSLRMLETDIDAQNVEITVTPNGDLAFNFDFDDSTPLVVLAYTALTNSVQFTVALPGSVIAGVRVVFRGVGSAQDGSIFTVDTVSAVDTVILRETPTVNFAATDVAYAGGPLTKPIRDAIIAHMNGEIVYADAGVPLPASTAGSKIGLQVLAEGIGPANPGGKYGTWSGSLVRNVLAKIAAYAKGARNVNVITPAADYDAVDPAFPNDAKINFIGPGRVLVRKG